MPSVAEIADLLNRFVAAADRQRVAAAATRSDVNATDLLALDIVRRHDGIAPGAFAGALHLTPGGANGVLRRLLRAKLIVRTTSPQDRRDVRLTITPRGVAVMTTGVGAWDQGLLQRLAEKPDRDDLMALLGEIAQATERRATALVDLAEQVNDPAHGVPRPGVWG